MVKQSFQLSLQASVDSLSDLNCASFHPLVRMYPIKEVPVESEALGDWLYQRFVEKEELLTHFYDTGTSHISQPHSFWVKTPVSRMILQCASPQYNCAVSRGNGFWPWRNHCIFNAGPRNKCNFCVSVHRVVSPRWDTESGLPTDDP